MSDAVRDTQTRLFFKRADCGGSYELRDQAGRLVSMGPQQSSLASETVVKTEHGEDAVVAVEPPPVALGPPPVASA